ncbi:glycosyltransferase [Olivibacter sp. CPCC 100613]|uniref:glycosyltransferase n=1 Tax=Olivibacter sp. CPCC 100613 TaxID=3079931 RepID=UPI002FFD1DF8
MNYLFFDIEITGHHSEYIGHLINYFKDYKREGNNVFIVHPHFKEKFPLLVSDARNAHNVLLVEITDEEYQRSIDGNLIKMSFSRFKLVKKYAKKYLASHVFLLHFNVFQFSLIFLRPSFKIRGILFLQFYRMGKQQWSERFKYLRKYLITKFYTSNKRIERVFILNDPSSVDYLNGTFRKGLFHVLNDPVPSLQPLNDFDVYSYYDIERHRKILLHPGALSDRKGTIEFIQSALFIKPELQNELVILVAGSPGGAQMSERIENEISQINESTCVRAVYDPGFLSNEKMKSILDQCYAIVIPYKHAEASSGILGHAAASNKPVISTGKGLLKELIETYSLGILIDEVNPELIAQKIEELLHHDYWRSDAAKFVAERTPENFASTLVV